MDDETVVQIATLLSAYPAAWDEDEDLLDEVLAIAAEQEALGVSVTQSNPQLATFLRLNLDYAEHYQALIWLNRQPIGSNLPQPAPSPQPAPQPAPSPQPPPLLKQIRDWLRPPLRLHLGSALRRSGEQGTAEPDRDRRTYSLDAPDVQLRIEIELQFMDGQGSLLTRLVPVGDRTIIEQAEVQLYTALPEGPGVAEPADRQSPDEESEAIFIDLSTSTTYYLAILLASGQPLIIPIEPTWWPKP